MPQEILRDVLRTGDASGRARRRLSILPVSIAVHAIAVGLFVMSPLATVGDLPAISSPLQAARYMPTIAPPSPPPPSESHAGVPRGAPIEAPLTIAPESAASSDRAAEGGLESSIGVNAGPPLVLGLEGNGPVPVPPSPPPQPTRPVRVGQGIREPKKILHVAPEYPIIAQRAGVEGTVILEAILDVTGKVVQVRVIRSHPLLDDAAVKAVQQWRYTPTELNGVPVPVLMTITVRFSLSRG